MKAQIRMIIASVIVIALALTAVSGITYSWFSDTEQSDITITTAKVDYTVTWAETGSSEAGTSWTVDSSAGTISISGLAAKATIPVVTKIENDSSIKTVYRIAAKISGIGTYTLYDLKNIMIAGKSLNVTGSYEGETASITYGETVITDWTSLDKEIDPSLQNIYITTPQTYGGDELNGTKVVAYNPETGEGYTQADIDGGSVTQYVAWSNTVAKTGLKIKLSIVAAQGDYPTADLDEAGTATVPANGVVQGAAKADEGAKAMDVTTDFSSVTNYGANGATPDTAVTGTKIVVESKATGAGTMAIGSVAAVGLTLQTTEGEEISSPTFDAPVEITAVIAGVTDDPGTVVVKYNGTTEGIETISSVYNATAQTLTVTFSTTHFSQFSIEPVGVNAAAKIGDTYYKTIDAAIEAYTDSDYSASTALVLESDITMPAQYTFEKDIIIDLNKHTYYFTKSSNGGYNTEIACNFTLKNGNVIQPENVPFGYFSVERPTSGSTITFEDVTFFNQCDEMESAIDVNLNDTPNLTVNLNVTKCTFNNKEIEIGGTDSGSGSTVITNIKSCTFNTGNIEIDANENSAVTTTIESCTFNNGKISIDSDEGSTVKTTITKCTFNSLAYTENSDYVVQLGGYYSKLTTVIDDCDFVINGLSGNSSSVIGIPWSSNNDLTVKGCDFDIKVGKGNAMYLFGKPSNSCTFDYVFQGCTVKVSALDTGASNMTILSGTNITLYIGDATTPDEWTGSGSKTVKFT